MANKKVDSEQGLGGSEVGAQKWSSGLSCPPPALPPALAPPPSCLQHLPRSPCYLLLILQVTSSRKVSDLQGDLDVPLLQL